MAQARRLSAPLVVALLVSGCGGSDVPPQRAPAQACAPADIRTASQLEPGAKPVPDDHLKGARYAFGRFVPDPKGLTGVVTDDGVAVIAAPVHFNESVADFFRPIDERTHWEHITIGSGEGRIGKDNSGQMTAIGLPARCTLAMVVGGDAADTRRVATDLHGR